MVLRDANTYPAYAVASTTVTYSDGAASGAFYSDSACSLALGSDEVTIASSTRSGIAYYKDTTNESSTISVTSSGLSGSSVTTTVAATVTGNTTIASKNLHTCAIVSGDVQCWGYNNYGQLGDGTTKNSSTPVRVAGLGATAEAVAVGEYFSCALLSDATVKCWGYRLRTTWK